MMGNEGKRSRGRPARRWRDELDECWNGTIWQRRTQDKHIWIEHTVCFPQHYACTTMMITHNTHTPMYALLTTLIHPCVHYSQTFTHPCVHYSQNPHTHVCITHNTHSPMCALLTTKAAHPCMHYSQHLHTHVCITHNMSYTHVLHVLSRHSHTHVCITHHPHTQ